METVVDPVTNVTCTLSALPTTMVRQTKTAQPANVEVSSSAPAAKSTGSSSSGLTADQQAALDAHNAARKEVGQVAQVWDESLANDAQEWATHLVSVGSLTHSEGSGQGENLYMQSSTGSPFANAAKMWIDEKSSYNGQAIGEGDFASYGHYSEFLKYMTQRFVTDLSQRKSSGAPAPSLVWLLRPETVKPMLWLVTRRPETSKSIRVRG